MQHQHLRNMPSTALERHLEGLAIRARSSSEQSVFMGEGLHHTLPLLLRREVDGPADGRAASWRMKAQAARLFANLAYQPPHKGAIVDAGGLRALADAANEALPHGFTESDEQDAPAAAALLLEAAAAIGNLASGDDARRSVVSGHNGDLVPLLSRMLRAPVEAASPGEQTAAAAAVANEAARALANLALCASTHRRIIEGGAPQSALPLLIECAQLGKIPPHEAPAMGRCHKCKALIQSDADAKWASYLASPGGGAEHKKASEKVMGLDWDITSPTISDELGRPLLSRLLLMLYNLLRVHEVASTLRRLMPGLEGALLHIALWRNVGSSSRSSEARARALQVCVRLSAVLSTSGQALIDAGAPEVLTRILGETTAAPEAAVPQQKDGAAAPPPHNVVDPTLIEAACTLIDTFLRDSTLRARLLPSPNSGATALLCALHGAWSRLPHEGSPQQHPQTTTVTPPNQSPPQQPATARGGVAPSMQLPPSAGSPSDRHPPSLTPPPPLGQPTKAQKDALLHVAQCCADLERWSPGLYRHALHFHVEPPFWSGCDLCHREAANTLINLTLPSPVDSRHLVACHGAIGSSIPSRASQLLVSGAASSETQYAVLTALHNILQSAPEMAVALSLGGAIPALLHLHRRRRAPIGVRDRAAMVLCAVAKHGEVGSHCVQHGVLSALMRLVTEHPDNSMRDSAQIAIQVIIKQSSMIHNVLAAGEVSPLVILTWPLTFAREVWPDGRPEDSAKQLKRIVGLNERMEESVHSSRQSLETSARLDPLLFSSDEGENSAVDLNATTASSSSGIEVASVTQIERLLLLARFTHHATKPEPFRNGREARAVLMTALSQEYAEAAVESGGGGGSTTAVDVRVSQLRQACALVLALLLVKRLHGAKGPMIQMSLKVMAAQYAFEALAARLGGAARGEAAGEEEAAVEPAGIVAAVLEEVTLSALGWPGQ